VDLKKSKNVYMLGQSEERKLKEKEQEKEKKLIFCLKRWDVLPVDDLGIRAGIQKLYNIETLPERKTTECFGQKWKPIVVLLRGTCGGVWN
jgi:hypothetical protein